MVVMVEILVAAVAIEAAGLRHGGYGVMSLLPWILFFFAGDSPLDPHLFI
jgi:hypothetical protein